MGRCPAIARVSIRIAINCGRHHSVSKPLVGNCPDCKRAVPPFAKELAVIPRARKPGLISWLRSIEKDQASLRLDWHRRGQLALSHRDASGQSATFQVPVEIHGNPPAINLCGFLRIDGRTVHGRWI